MSEPSDRLGAATVARHLAPVRTLLLAALAAAVGLSVASLVTAADEPRLMAAATVEPSAPTDERETFMQQSPIDLPPVPPNSAHHHEIAIHYADTAEHLIHKDHTIEVEYDPGSEIEFDGEHFRLQQLHFHTPSEHLVAHRRFPVELHLVHRSDAGQLLVLGVLFEVGAPNSFIERILEDAPRGIGRVDLEGHLNVAKLFPADTHFYAYEGSLTTAPFDEGIQWLVLSEHPSVSPEQVVRLLVLEGGNARPIQPLGDRVIDGS